MKKQNIDMVFGGKTTSNTLKLEESKQLEHEKPDLPDEDWVPIQGFEGLYAVSDYGRIRRLVSGTNTYAGKVLSPIINRKTGYPYVKLVKNGKTHKAKLHLTVAQAFLDPPSDPNFIVNHIDGNKLNAHVKNLEWISRSENTKHAIKLGLQPLCYAEKNGMSKLSNEQVEEIKRLYATKEYTQQQLADKFELSKTYVNYLLNGKYRNEQNKVS